MTSITSNLQKTEIGLNTYTPSELVEALIALYNRQRPIPIVLGSPGGGKTSLIYKAFRDKLKVPVYVFQAMLYDPTEIKGLPVYYEETVGNKTRKIARFIPFTDMPTSSGKVRAVLFIDDLPHAPKSTQNAFMRIALEGIAGAWDIGNMFVIGAGNRSIDRAGANDLQTAMANRFCIMNLVSSYPDWRDWAITNDIYTPIIAFLGSPQGRDSLNTFDSTKQINATQRSWEFASEAMYALQNSNNQLLCRKAVAGCVGDSAMTKFFGWLKVYKDLPDINEILKGKNLYGKDLDIQYATVTALISTVKREEKNKKMLFERVIDYAVNMPNEFSELGALLGQDLFNLDNTIFKKINIKKYYDRYNELIF